MNKNSIEITDLTFGYTKNLIFSSANLFIHQNSFNLIIGPNGAGKTTLLKLMIGLLQPKAGTIKVHQSIGYVPQALSFDEEFPISVLEFVLLGALDKLNWLGRYTKEDKIEARKLIHKMGLCQKTNKPIFSLSLGQRQRLLIAHALLRKPRILLLDEPTSSLDKESTSLIFTQLLELKKTTTIVFISHQPPKNLKEIDRVIYIDQAIQDLDADAICRHFNIGLCHTQKEDANND